MPTQYKQSLFLENCYTPKGVKCIYNFSLVKNYVNMFLPQSKNIYKRCFKRVKIISYLPQTVNSKPPSYYVLLHLVLIK